MIDRTDSIKPGDCVHIKQFDRWPEMIVDHMEVKNSVTRVHCKWFSEVSNKFEREDFNVEVLEKIHYT